MHCHGFLLLILGWLAHPLPAIFSIGLWSCEQLGQRIDVRLGLLMISVVPAILMAALATMHQPFPTHAPLFATGVSQFVFERYYHVFSIAVLLWGLALQGEGIVLYVRLHCRYSPI